MQYFKRIAEKCIDWAVPVFCAGALLLWQRIPVQAQHYWPVICVAVIGMFGLVIAIQSRRDIKHLREMREQDRHKDDAMGKAFRAMLDDNMGSLYAACVARGYTTEDERRRYARLDAAYEACEGNGEAKRRKVHFEAIPDEETWKAMHHE